MVAHLQRKPDLGLEHAFRPAFAAPVQEQNDGPGLVFVAPELLGHIDLEPVGNALDLDLAIQEPGFLRGGSGGVGWFRPSARASGGGEQPAGNTNAAARNSRKTNHARRSHHKRTMPDSSATARMRCRAFTSWIGTRPKRWT